MPFRTRGEADVQPHSPEELFRSLSPSDPSLRHLWAHQADLLREYASASSEHDIALELPTGAGKTLVGLLIAEYRRRTATSQVSCVISSARSPNPAQRQTT